MLIPAYVMQSELEEAFRASMRADPGRFTWYRLGSASPWIRPPQNDDWNFIDRVSVCGKRVVGRMQAAVDRDCMIVTELAVASVAPGSVAFMMDLDRFTTSLLRMFALVRFSVVVGIPAERIWRRWVRQNGGRELCVMRRYARLVDGSLCSSVLFEVPGSTGAE